MRDYPIEKYEFEIRQHPEYLGVETIAKSTYAGKEVTGKAICRIDDQYNEELGMRLAAARCAAKIARKRLKRADKMSLEAANKSIEAKRHLDNMNHYYEDAREAFIEAECVVDNIIKELG